MCQVAFVLLNEALLTLQPCHSLAEKRTSKCVSAFVSSRRHLSSPGCENLNKAWHEGALGRLQLPVYHSGEVSWPFSNMKCLKMDLWLCFQTEMESGDSPRLVEPRGNLKGLCSGSTFRSPPPPPPSSSFALWTCQPQSPINHWISFQSLEQCPAYPGFITDSQRPRQVKPPHLVLQPWPWLRPCWHGCSQPHHPCIPPLPATVWWRGGAPLSAWLMNKCHFHFTLTPLPHFNDSSYKLHTFRISFDLYLSY